MPRYFTKKEAERLLPHVEQAIRAAIELKKFYVEAEMILQQEARRVMAAGGVAANSMQLEPERSRRDTCAARLRDAIETIHSYGCEVKDLDIGLIDFRTLYRGQEVYLCWKLGEEGIRFWHGLTEGFPGRKEIDEEFLANHRGTTVH
ncbi:MAG: DUF2203 domain-containing protein [Bryobacterales bacterium]|nr:DUF2203 domain-containing protein [Bryobacterales bacterium]